MRNILTRLTIPMAAVAMLAFGLNRSAVAQESCLPGTSPVVYSQGQVGQRIVNGATALTIESVSRSAELGRFTKAEPGKTFLVMDVKIEAVGQISSAYNPGFFVVKDANAVEHSSTATILDGGLRHGELLPGEQVRGKVGLQIPTDAQSVLVTYRPGATYDLGKAIRVSIG